MLHILVFSFHSKAKMLDKTKVCNSSDIGSNVQLPNISHLLINYPRWKMLPIRIVSYVCIVLGAMSVVIQVILVYFKRFIRFGFAINYIWCTINSIEWLICFKGSRIDDLLGSVDKQSSLSGRQCLLRYLGWSPVLDNWLFGLSCRSQANKILVTL